jgi:DNA-binding CsgD family transcriptional regulator
MAEIERLKAAQRQWVGLTDAEKQWIRITEWTVDELIEWVNTKLKEKNT